MRGIRDLWQLTGAGRQYLADMRRHESEGSLLQGLTPFRLPVPQSLRTTSLGLKRTSQQLAANSEACGDAGGAEPSTRVLPLAAERTVSHMAATDARPVADVGVTSVSSDTSARPSARPRRACDDSEEDDNWENVAFLIRFAMKAAGIDESELASEVQAKLIELSTELAAVDAPTVRRHDEILRECEQVRHGLAMLALGPLRSILTLSFTATAASFLTACSPATVAIRRVRPLPHPTRCPW